MAENKKNVKCNKEWCSAINCTNSRKKNPHLSFFRFPEDPERCKKWVLNVRRDDLHSKPVEKLHKNNFVCALHFEDSQFMNPNETRKKLIHNAIPTIFEVPNHRDNPDCGQFTSTLQQCMVDKFMHSSSSKNCKDDIDSFLFGLQNLSKLDASKSSNVQSTESSNQTLDSSHVPSLLNIQQGNVLAYIGGYIWRKISTKVCSNCRHSLSSENDNVNHIFIQHKQYSALSTLHVQSVFLMEICSQLESAFTSVALRTCHGISQIRNHLVQQVCVKVPACENCDTKTLVTQLFITIRLHHSLRESNKSFVAINTRRNRKMLKLTHV